MEAITGRDYFGKKRTSMDQMKDMVTSFVPISARGFMGDQKKEQTMWEALGASFGFNAKKFNNVEEVYKLADKWKKENKIVSRGEFIYDPSADPYRDIKLAISKRDDADAIAAIREATTKGGLSPMKLTQHFSKYAETPFTGNRMNEAKFIKSLDADGKEAYKAAVQEKNDIFKQFLKYRNLYLKERNKPSPQVQAAQAEAKAPDIFDEYEKSTRK